MSNNIHFDLHANDDEVPYDVITVSIYPSVTTISHQAFRNCYKLESLTLPNSITTIGISAFYECSNLSSLTLPNSITAIGAEAFYGCSNLQSLTLPNSITAIGDGAFDGCDALEQRLPNGLNNNAHTISWLRQRFNNLPLHQSVYNTATLTATLLTNLIVQHRSTLTTTDAMGMTPLHVLCSNPNVESLLEMAQILVDAKPEVAFMTTVMGHTPLMMLLHLKGIQCNEYYHKEDGELKLLPLVGLLERLHLKGIQCNRYGHNEEDNQIQLELPIVRLLERGINYDFLEATLILHKRQLMPEIDVEDEVSGLLPFMYAASLTKCNLDTVYQLAIQRPDLLQKNII